MTRELAQIIGIEIKVANLLDNNWYIAIHDGRPYWFNSEGERIRIASDIEFMMINGKAKQQLKTKRYEKFRRKKF